MHNKYIHLRIGLIFNSFEVKIVLHYQYLFTYT